MDGKRLQDPDYLRNVAYPDATRLNARINFWKKYGSNEDETYGRYFDLLVAPQNARVLELGCGPGHIWRWGIDHHRVPVGWDITLTDLSEGMLDEAGQRLATADRSFSFQSLDAANLPFADSSFDLVVANYMLYHVTDPAQTVAEIHRVLEPGGRLYATTNSIQHISEITELQRQFAVNADDVTSPTSAHDAFSMEKASAILGSQFTDVEIHPESSTAKVDDATLLVDFVGSLSLEIDLEALRNHVTKVIRTVGHLAVTRSTGIFIATR